MGTGQMVLVLLGAMLFSSILITTYNGLADQADMMYNGLNLLQAQKLGDRYLQKVDAEISGGVISYDETYALYHNNISYVTDTLRTINFRTNIRANYCNSSGDTTAAGGFTSYMRIDVRVLFNSETGKQLRAGTLNAPLSRVIADMDI